MSKSKFWQDPNSLDSKKLTNKKRKLARIKQYEYEVEQRELQRWADQGFVSSSGSDDVPFADDEW